MLYILIALLLGFSQCDTIITLKSGSESKTVITVGNTSCIIENDQLEVNGEPKGKLTDEQKADLQRYLKESSNWSQLLHRTVLEEIGASITDFFHRTNNFWKALFNKPDSKEALLPSSNATENKKSSVSIPKVPIPPAFCSGENVALK